ncbi:MAG TPA: TlpA disulfide reductase family protein [Thermoanaerobaculia bacterium]|nr:TlpA disulfide reductase family protein [Thermoanaerobaculia bacterium]
MTTRSLQILVLASAVVVGVFHGFLKSPVKVADIGGDFALFRKSMGWTDRMAPDFELARLDGTKVRLADEVGKKLIVLNFFATWCGPCRDEMPGMAGLPKRFQGKPFELLAIDVKETPAKVRALLSQLHLELPVILDRDGAVAHEYEVDSFPTTVIIGGNGRVVSYRVGEIPNIDASLVPALKVGVAGIERGGGISKQAYLSLLAAKAGGAKSPAAKPDSSVEPKTSGAKKER